QDLEGLTLLQELGGEGTRHEEYIYGKVAHQNEHLFGVFRDSSDAKRHYKTYGVGGNYSDNLMFMYRGRVETDAGWVFKATLLESDGSISIANYKERFEPWEMSHQDYVVEKDFGNNRNLVLRYARYRDYSANQLYTDYTLSVASGTIDHADDVTIQMNTIEALYNFTLAEKHFLTVGAQQQEVKDTGHDMKAGIENKWLETRGFFVSDSIKAHDKLNLQLIARSDESFESDSETSWSVAADYKITEKLNLGAGLSRTVRFPNVQELYRGSRVYGNENLEPEKSDNLELRLGYQVNNDWNLALTRFDSDIENKISQVITAGGGVIAGVGTLKANDAYYINIDEARVAGWEVGVDGKINTHFAAWFSYTRLDCAEDKTRNLRLVSKPEYRMTGGTKFHADSTTAMLTCEHQGPIRATQTLDSAGKATNYAEVDSSTSFNLALRQQFTDSFSLYLNVENLADKDDMVLIQASDAKNKTGLLIDPIYYLNGRKFTLGAEVKF
ncbi:MAG: enterobactin receptor protein, partial [uncultured bacterium]